MFFNGFVPEKTPRSTVVGKGWGWREVVSIRKSTAVHTKHPSTPNQHPSTDINTHQRPSTHINTHQYPSTSTHINTQSTPINTHQQTPTSTTSTIHTLTWFQTWLNILRHQTIHMLSRCIHKRNRNRHRQKRGIGPTSPFQCSWWNP